MAEGFNGQVLMDQPAGTGNRPYAAESWLEPWLIKHSSFYRKHFTHDGRTESKATRRHSVVTEGLEVRKNSLAVPETGATSSQPAPAQQPRTGSEADATVGKDL